MLDFKVNIVTKTNLIAIEATWESFTKWRCRSSSVKYFLHRFVEWIGPRLAIVVDKVGALLKTDSLHPSYTAIMNRQSDAQNWESIYSIKL